MYLFEAACTIQVRAMAGSSGADNLIMINQAVLDGAKAQIMQGTRGLGGALAWPALLRKLDRSDSSYRN
jgi:hypothetical protein